LAQNESVSIKDAHWLMVMHDSLQHQTTSTAARNFLKDDVFTHAIVSVHKQVDDGVLCSYERAHKPIQKKCSGVN